MEQNLPAKVEGVVTRFKGHGRQLGYPTANLNVQTDLRDGIYFGYADLGDMRHKPALIFIGTPTTMGETRRRVEAHLLDIPDTDYYDLPLSLFLLEYHRPNQTFQNAEELSAVLRADEIAGRKWFQSQEVAMKANKDNT